MALIAIGFTVLFILAFGAILFSGDMRDPWGVVADRMECEEKGHIPKRSLFGDWYCKRCMERL